LFLSGDGWLFGRSASLTWTKGTLKQMDSLAIDGGASSLELSPEGGSFAVMQYRARKRGEPAVSRYLIGRFADDGRAPRGSDAMTIAFLDDETLLALEQLDTDSLELRAERLTPDSVGGPIVLWRQNLPPIETPRVIVDRARHAWLVVGKGEGDLRFVVVSDSI